MTIDSTTATEPDFISRHIGPDHGDVAAMLKVVGQPSLEAVLATARPSIIRRKSARRLTAAPPGGWGSAEVRPVGAGHQARGRLFGRGRGGVMRGRGGVARCG